MKLFASEDKKQRLQVFLSHSGACSRRKAFLLIQQGHVRVNQEKITEPSFAVGPQDKVFLDGKLVQEKQFQYVIFYKQEGVTTTLKDDFAEKTVLDVLPKALKHLKPVGRLDKNTEGLLLLTNDGPLAYKLTHPKFNIDKIYAVAILKPLASAHKQQLEQGILLDSQKTYPCRIFDVKSSKNKTSLRIMIHEGRKRQIRRMFSTLGYTVIYLKREQHGPLTLGSLQPGQWRNLNLKEIQSLQQL